jgi:hypothetical protein
MLKFLTLLAMLGVPTIAAAQDCTIVDDMPLCSGGASAMRLGDTTFFDDGSTCTQIGNQLFCD